MDSLTDKHPKRKTAPKDGKEESEIMNIQTAISILKHMQTQLEKFGNLPEGTIREQCGQTSEEYKKWWQDNCKEALSLAVAKLSDEIQDAE